MAPTDYSIADVSALTGTPVRTIRYYIAEGLLPAPGRYGSAARYDDGFVARLRAIRRLQERHLPLAEIRRTLEGLPDASVIDAVQPAETPPTDSASEYVRRLLGTAEESVPYATPPAAAPAAIATPPAVPAAIAPPALALRADLHPAGRFVPPASDAPPPPTLGMGRAYAIPAEAGEPAAGARSHWERIAITPDIEIHIRRPLSRPASKRAERLVEVARDIFDEGA
jgi:DNA-binding transcriptional MerR regulator